MSATIVAAAPSRARARSVIGAAFREYRREWKRLVPAALLLTLGTSLLGLLLKVLLEGSLGTIGAAVVAVLTVFLLPIWLQAMDLQERADAWAGEDESSLGEAIAQLRPRMLRLLGATLLVSVLVALGSVLLIVPGLVLAARWSQLVPAIVVEHRGVRDAFRRSSELVRGRGWMVIGVIALNLLIVLPFFLALPIGFGLTMSADFADFFWRLIAETLVAPFSALVLTSLYFCLADVPDARRGSPPSVETSFARERRMPGLAWRALALAGAVLTPVALFLPFGESGEISSFEALQSSDLIATQLGVTCACLVVLSLFSATRMPLLGVTAIGCFLLGQWLSDEQSLPFYGLGGYLLLGSALAVCIGGAAALLARPVRGPRAFA